MKHSFGSDNHSGIHPAILKAVENANTAHQVAYGDDEYTAQVQTKFKQLFGEKTEAYFVFNGTAANVLCLKALTDSYHAVICASTAHINVDECGAPERITGCKLLSVDTPDGKLTPELVRPLLHGFGEQHHSQPKVISISQSTEYGTLYRPEEIKALADLAHAYDMYLHIDGARLANAAAALNLPFRAFTVDAGADALSFGGTKNGLMLGEAAVFFRPELARNFLFKRKQHMQLYSKMRFIAAQFDAFLTNELYRDIASQANEKAQLLAKQIKREAPKVHITQPVEVNAVFAVLPEEAIKPLQEKYCFYVWDEAKHEVRWMCSFNTTEADIDEFVQALKTL